MSDTPSEDTLNESKQHGANFCNTNKKVRADNKKARAWCFTLNNYTQTDINKIINTTGTKYVFQEEKGELGTKHLQGYIRFENAKTLGGVRRILNKAHWGITRSPEASIIYCSKVETRDGAIYKNIDIDEQRTTTAVIHNVLSLYERWRIELIERMEEDIKWCIDNSKDLKL